MNLHNRFALSTATVELTEFGDFTCFQSREIRKLIDTVVESFKGHLSYRYCYLPDPDNTQSLLAALALEAAKRQGQFGPMYRVLLTQPTVNCVALYNQAKTLRLDTHQFMQDLLDESSHNILKEDWQMGYELGVRNTPAIFINGHRFYGKFTLSRLIPFVRLHISRPNALVPFSDFLPKHIYHK